jgi:lipoprotein signal peptidase
MGYLLASFGIYMVDQSTKAWAVRALRFGEDRSIVRGFLDLIYMENRGIAFGQLQEGGAFGRWFFVVLASAAAVAARLEAITTPVSAKHPVTRPATKPATRVCVKDTVPHSTARSVRPVSQLLGR